jgi:hypothetical protein
MASVASGAALGFSTPISVGEDRGALEASDAAALA